MTAALANRAQRRAPVRAFRHECLLHHGDAGFLDATLPPLCTALEDGRPAFVAVTPHRIGLLRQALGADAARVRFADMRELGTNPARIIPAWRAFLGEHPRRAVFGIGEPVWPGRSAEELRECRLHESLLNAAFDGGAGWDLLCPYDIDALDAETVASAHRSHPHVRNGAGCAGSEHYDAALATLELALIPPAPGARSFPFTIQDLGVVRAHVAAAAAAAGLAAERTHDLVLAIDELATNSVTHGGGAGNLRLWSDGADLVCEIRDRGRLRDPLVGRVRPQERQLSGRGLWIVNQLCDLVQIRTGRAGTTVRVRMHTLS